MKTLKQHTHQIQTYWETNDTLVLQINHLPILNYLIKMNPISRNWHSKKIPLASRFFQKHPQ